ncbi:MAG TPA: helix-turn-helix domain-containing protein [Candidatus Binatus sp.]|nr:helix-turn-helix domain-containing protein [Candidatus Binatus sp.]
MRAVRTTALHATGQQTMSSKDPFDWSDWMHALGRQGRRLREFLGLSQEELARMAGVSQGAVSRLEAGRGLATPMLVILKINLALTHRLRTVDPGLLNDDLRRALEIEQRLSPPIAGIGFQALPITKDPELEDLVRIYRQMPERQRQTFLSVVRATARALGATATDDEEEA